LLTIRAYSAKGGKKTRGIDFVDLGGVSADVPRLKTTINELDRVTGGGLVPGSALLVGGDPGIGKSTLLLQAVGALAKSGLKTAYISGEESAGQVRRRAKRLGVSDAPVSLASETSLGPILDGLMASKPDVVIIDSIQTLWTDQLGVIAPINSEFCGRIKTALARRMKLAFLKCAIAACPKCLTPPLFSLMDGAKLHLARQYSQGLKAHALSLRKSKP